MVGGGRKIANYFVINLCCFDVIILRCRVIFSLDAHIRTVTVVLAMGTAERAHRHLFVI